ncbi:PepSY-associated TM helix domain-containing protein [Aeoliella mucimassa]|uniref:PepSY-associated TM helix n=1 Tax=Aeoliella mucimassa TaxID=2527972 RepID=A0A518AGU5_9BACT|nr:PepSY-associated TM helix domain-containing protein [Aeoliella mucimassa]QDU53919.1 hypothetical protein Pan181_00970 [Aeoliella mucimassa]
MKVKWRAWALFLHRDLGYFFTGVVVLYAVSGLAMNHAGDWNPNFVVASRDLTLELPNEATQVTTQQVRRCLAEVGEEGNYRSHDFISSQRMKIYLTNGDMVVNLANGSTHHETIGRRPVLYYLNRLHLNPAKWWKVFSDVFAICLVLIAVTGMIVVRGRNGLAGRGKWLVAAGLIVPLLAMFLV